MYFPAKALQERPDLRLVLDKTVLTMSEQALVEAALRARRNETGFSDIRYVVTRTKAVFQFRKWSNLERATRAEELDAKHPGFRHRVTDEGDVLFSERRDGHHDGNGHTETLGRRMRK